MKTDTTKSWVLNQKYELKDITVPCETKDGYFGTLRVEGTGGVVIVARYDAVLAAPGYQVSLSYVMCLTHSVGHDIEIGIDGEHGENVFVEAIYMTDYATRVDEVLP